MKFFVKEKLGLTRSVTPDGFLLIENTPVARTGEMIYGPGETPVEVGPDGISRIDRSPEEVFRPETIASCAGKPIVNEHPESDVNPDNWNELAVGVMMHPRRGVGAMDDTLLADLLVTNRGAIEDINSGKLELSLGYDADYDQLAPGRGRQKNIIVNHCAIVDSGRCGSRCAIGDSKTVKEKRMTWLDKLRAALKKSDVAAATAVLDEIPENEDGTTVVHNHIHVADAKAKDADKEDEDDDEKKKEKKTQDAVRDSVFADKRFTDLSADVKAIKDAVMDKKDDEEDEDEEKKKTEDNEKIDALGLEAPPGTGDKAAKAKDSAYLEDSFQETIAMAEIISPGIQVPTFDKALAPGKTYDALCAFRRKVLDKAYQFHEETHDYVEELLAGRKMEDMKCVQVRDMFRAVGTWRKRYNNDRTRSNDTRDGVGGGTGVRSVSVRSIADVNKRNAEFYK
jgi:uncharacterized protein